MTHSILAPSAAGMWAKCAGWVVMSHSFPEAEDSEAARLGTAAHEVAAQYVDSYSRGAAYNPRVGEYTSNNVAIDDEMLDATEMYADDVRRVMIETGVFGGHYFGLEKPLQMPLINENMFGTSDCFIVDIKNRTVYIWDYKHGFDPVHVFENWQLISYAAGVINELVKHTPFILDMCMDFKFVFRVAQPRAFHSDGPIREWTIKLGDLIPYFNQLRAAAELALSGTGEAQSGPHCRYCSARHGCAAAISAAFRLYEVSAQALPLQMSDDAIATQLLIVSRAAKQLEAIKSALEEQVEGLIKRGKHVRGWQAVPKTGRETWSKPVEEIHALGDMLGADLRKIDAVTPKQARKLGIDAAVIKEYSHTTTSGIKIVPDDGSKARHIFGVL